MSLIFENDDLKITGEFGDSGITIVSFAGISFGLLEAGEFRHSLSETNNDIYHVFDKKRLWYNGPHERLIPDVLNREIERRNSKIAFTLGNSMGGAGAIIFAADIKYCKRAISFCPQSSVYPKIVDFENRWSDYRRAITDWTVPDVIERMRPTREYIMFFGADDVRDLSHASRFRKMPLDSVNIFTIPGCGHNVAAYLKKAGMLAKIVSSLTDPTFRPICWANACCLGSTPPILR